MKTRLYGKWLKFVVSEFRYDRRLKRPDGKYLLALRLWRYDRLFPDADNWVSETVAGFKAAYAPKRASAPSRNRP